MPICQSKNKTRNARGCCFPVYQTLIIAFPHSRHVPTLPILFLPTFPHPKQNLKENLYVLPDRHGRPHSRGLLLRRRRRRRRDGRRDRGHGNIDRRGDAVDARAGAGADRATGDLLVPVGVIVIIIAALVAVRAGLPWPVCGGRGGL